MEEKMKCTRENFDRVCAKLKEYEDTGMSPEMIREQNRQLKACVKGEMLPLPKYVPGSTAFLVIPGFGKSMPFIAECCVTGYDWDRRDGFELVVEGTGMGHSERIFREIPFKKADTELFGTCEEAGRRLDEMKRKQEKEAKSYI